MRGTHTGLSVKRVILVVVFLLWEILLTNVAQCLGDMTSNKASENKSVKVLKIVCMNG